MRIGAGLMGPKSENVDFSQVFQAFLKGPRCHGESGVIDQPERADPSGRVFLDHFGITLHIFRSFWGYFGFTRVTLESLWPVFKMYSFFQRILMIL